MKNKSLTKILLAGLLITGASCTKLDENQYLYDRVTGDQFGTTNLELSSLVGAAYSNLAGIGGNNHYIPLNEVTTDEMVVPTRGADWGDGGHWVRLKTHTYNSTDPTPGNGWSFCYTGVSTCNRLIATLASLNSDQAKAYIAELKVLRAVYYYWLLDWYGNVPLSIDYADTKPPTNATRQEVYDFIEKELTENAPLLPKTGPNDASTYGRVNYYTAYACLAKLYLNAKVYTGTAHYDKAIAACDEIINSGKYSLAANYVDNFVPNNQASPEFIFAIPFDHVHFGGFNMGMMTLSYLNQGTYNINAQPWNGFATVSEFYNSYIDPAQNPGPQGTVVGLDPKGTPITGTIDKRAQANFIVGPQYDSKGNRLLDGGADATDPDGPPLTFTPYINQLEPQAWRQSGARIGKWQFYSGMTSNLDNDFAIFRYADILLTKAEAVARQNNNWSDPVTMAIINQIRVQHGGVSPLPSLDAKSFLAERSREMFGEAWKRQDMIRFGTYNDAYLFHNADPADQLGPNGINHLNIFPIPNTQIDANHNLKQNPGYQ
ncbi:MAG TPA: RagB/SusD family nutrient uptake outer membrane protein [Chitinophagaceae bacterium]|nr:RagB/SusD family nutrient uptake outer membrane protein [Chitinophagaceae bacterium]